MFSILAVGLLCVNTVYGSISGHIASGTCVCVTGNTVNARHEAGLHGHIVGSVHHGECYTFNGGILTKDGYHWYQLQHVHGGLAWVAGNYLQTSTHSHCSGGSSTGGSSTGTFATGLVSQHCMQCMCDVESGCRPLPCAWDVNSNSCGYFQIKEAYWIDCGRPEPSWEACSLDLHCASLCVQKYMARYIGFSGCPHNCENYARIHNGGPKGCTHTGTLGYWSHIQSKGCHA